MYEYIGIAFIPVIVGLVEIVKRIGLKDKYAPVCSLLFGIILGLVYAPDADFRKGLMHGIYFGLSASGLYSGVKNVSEELKL